MYIWGQLQIDMFIFATYFCNLCKYPAKYLEAYLLPMERAKLFDYIVIRPWPKIIKYDTVFEPLGTESLTHIGKVGISSDFFS